MLDDLDRAIIEALQVDARRTNRDVAATVGVAPTTALDRTRALRERGVIRGAHLDIDLAAIGRPVQALVAGRIHPASREIVGAFEEWVAGLPEVLDVFVTAGAADFVLRVAVADNPALYAFSADRLSERSEVSEVRTSLIYEHRHNDRLGFG